VIDTNEARSRAQGLFVDGEKVASGILCDMADELDSLRAATEWRPISEAPKDGTEVLVFINRSKFNGGLTVGIGRYSPISEGCRKVWFVNNSHCSSDPEPTHWMPKPAGPKGDAKK
jgi:hypothetical protein